MDLFGQVQGVGLRPFLFRLAEELGLRGRICNSPQGARVELDGAPVDLDSFRSRVLSEAREPIRIDRSETRFEAPRGFTRLEIVIEQASVSSKGIRFAIPADRATCAECWRDFFDPVHRMGGYPFISCTACGPRWSVLRTLPFERSETSYAEFPLCLDCEKEYRDPSSRRFHAQTLSCVRCGPRLKLELPGGYGGSGELFESMNALLKTGGVGLVKGMGGYQLVCDAENAAAIERIRMLKCRPEKALAVMIRDQETFRGLGGRSEDWTEMTGPAAPILSVPGVGLRTRAVLAPDLRELGVMAPTTPLHLRAMGELRALVVTSGNGKGRPIPVRRDEISFELGREIDFILDHDRVIERAVDDSVVRRDLILRAARGLAPRAESYHRGAGQGRHWLALGTDLKNAPAIATAGDVVELPYAGELRDVSLVERQKAEVGRALGLLGSLPGQVAKDIHPESLTGLLGPEGPEACVGVPHHLAHALAVRAELGSELVLAFDGTGTNEAHELWGGEGFLFDQETGSHRRVLTLRATHLVGGEEAIRHPWRSLVTMSVEGGASLEDCREMLPDVDSEELELQYALSKKHFGPLCSSMGRWFDGASALIEFGAREQSYEAQAPLRLETAAAGAFENARIAVEPCAHGWIHDRAGLLEIDGVAILRRLFALKKEGRFGLPQLAFLAHELMARAVAAAVERTGARSVGVGGGVFQNELFFSRLKEACEERSIAVSRPRARPVNDQAIAYGQLIYLEGASACTS